MDMMCRCAAWLGAIVVTGGCVASTPESPESQERTLAVTATAYNSTRAQTTGDPTEAAWGDELEPGMQVIAVSPDLLEQGLRPGLEVEIEGLDGIYTVLDRTASRHRNRIDIYMGKDIEAAREWGVQDVTITWSE
jgi:3D (Asp-Asp-Asp) domain-containing protein